MLTPSQLTQYSTGHGYGSGSQKALRIRNLDVLVRDLKDNGPGTQRQLAQRTGLSQATVSNLVRILVANGRASTASTISSGRRAVLVTALPA
jgi:DNA-binding MarR family transcriptional regulator